jgi:hypothetical protein
MPLSPTYIKLASTILSSTSTSVSFTGITSTFTDLILVINASVSSGNPDVIFNLNSDTSTNYSRTTVRGNGTTGSSTQSANATAAYTDSAASANTLAGAWNAIIHFMNYSNINTYKTILVRENHADLGSSLITNLWRSTAAITSILFQTTNSPTNFSAGSTFNLYGIKKA